MASSGARFTINGTPSSPRGFMATPNQVLTLTLEQNPAVDVAQGQVVYSILRANPGAPAVAFSPTSGQPATSNGNVTLTMPATPGSYIVQCQTNGGAPVVAPDGSKDFSVNTYTRGVWVPTPNDSLRLLVFGESSEFTNDAWVKSVNDLILATDASSGAAVTSVSGSCTTTDATTAVQLVQVPVATGFCGWLRVIFTGEIASGGNAGKRFLAEFRELVRNPTGTPTGTTGTVSPAPLIGVDETGAVIGGSNLQSAVFTANLVTLSVKGVAATTVKWGAEVETVYFAE